ncbi:uncharacterized protein J3D65DRAFT_642548 [Phyllosticta citribraziliensis]|uniref:Uncharacterized protein n=1 Tax=Phyllosticta citribraziliensis TaxID=989973 RepID=A0ABR1L7H1_9PEZI
MYCHSSSHIFAKGQPMHACTLAQVRQTDSRFSRCPLPACAATNNTMLILILIPTLTLTGSDLPCPDAAAEASTYVHTHIHPPTHLRTYIHAQEEAYASAQRQGKARQPCQLPTGYTKAAGMHTCRQLGVLRTSKPCVHMWSTEGPTFFSISISGHYARMRACTVLPGRPGQNSAALRLSTHRRLLLVPIHTHVEGKEAFVSVCACYTLRTPAITNMDRCCWCWC